MTHEEELIIQENVSGNEVTSGEYATESEACQDFDYLISMTSWIVHKEVIGEIRQPRCGADLKESLRIDRILEPSRELINKGWNHGFIGVEIKRSNVKLGPVINQVIDYSRCSWKLSGGRRVECEYNFIWKVRAIGGNLASIMTGNKIGIATTKSISCPREELQSYPFYRDRKLGFCLKFNGNNVFYDESIFNMSSMGGNRVGSRNCRKVST
jgi:hypothetical protein